MAIAAGFTGGVGDVRVDGVTECWLILGCNGEVRLGNKIHINHSIGLCGGGAVGNFLTLALRRGTPPIVPTPPSGITYLTDDAPFDFSIVDGRAGVAGSFTNESDFAAEFAGFLRSLEFHLEFRPLVLFNIDGRIAAWAGGDLQTHAAQHAVARCSELAAERAVIVGSVLLAGNLFAIAIAEDDRHE